MYVLEKHYNDYKTMYLVKLYPLNLFGSMKYICYAPHVSYVSFYHEAEESDEKFWYPTRIGALRAIVKHREQIKKEKHKTKITWIIK